MFIFCFCDEYFHSSCNALCAGEDKDNFNLDMSTEGEIVKFSRTLALLTAKLRKLLPFYLDLMFSL